METDRKLLELAAKAAGMAFDWKGLYGILPAIFSDDGEPTKWDPLADDGDALRLAVKLGLNIETRGDQIWVGPDAEILVHEFYEDDAMAATRRAIVRAAAHIGASKET